MASVLDAAHRSGVIHRDFKSGNVILVPESTGDRSVITAFGIARAAVVANSDQSVGLGTPRESTEGFVGTPGYMAPEQVMGEPVGPRADIYALGIVTFELLTGRLPITGETPMELGMGRVNKEPASARSLVPEVDERWEAVIARCLARDPSPRFATAGRIVDALAGSVDLGAHATKGAPGTVEIRSVTDRRMAPSLASPRRP